MYTQGIHLFGRIPTLYQNTHINWFNLYHFNNIVIHVYKRYQLYQVLQHKGYKMTVPSFNCDTLKILKWWLLVIINVIKVFECCTFQFFHFFFLLYECCTHGNTFTVWFWIGLIQLQVCHQGQRYLLHTRSEEQDLLWDTFSCSLFGFGWWWWQIQQEVW